jgi:hypothetical protein
MLIAYTRRQQLIPAWCDQYRLLEYMLVGGIPRNNEVLSQLLDYCASFIFSVTYLRAILGKPMITMEK